MKQWFKLTDSAVMSLKWQRIARKLGVSPAVVSFVYVAAMSSASQCNDRGSLRDFHPEDIDAFGGLDDGTTDSIFQAMKARGLITPDGRIAEWDKFCGEDGRE